MEMMVLFLVLIAFAVAAPRYGADSRTTLGASRATRPPTWSPCVAGCRRPGPADGGRDTRRSGSVRRSRNMVDGSTEDRRSAAAE
jgi:hypothetical protein